VARKPNLRRVLDALAAHFDGRLDHGHSFGGVLTVDNLDIEVSIKVRDAMTRDVFFDYRAQALDMLRDPERGDWHDSCDVTVKDRGNWRPSKSTKGCEKRPVVAVVEKVQYAATPRISFRCRVHVDKHRDPSKVIATIPLTTATLDGIRKKRKADKTMREEFARMSESEKIAHDAKLEGRHDDANKILADKGTL